VQLATRGGSSNGNSLGDKLGRAPIHVPAYSLASPSTPRICKSFPSLRAVVSIA